MVLKRKDMKQRALILFLLLLNTVTMTAQRHFYPSRPRDDAARYEGPVYGIKGGLVAPRLYYSSSALCDLPHELLLKPSASCFVELPLSTDFTIAPELNYQQRGGATSYQFNGQNERYSLLAHYVSARVSVCCYMPMSDRFKPYVFVSPEFGVPVAGSIRLKSAYYDVETPINNSNINRLHAGMLGGLGLRLNIPMKSITMVLKLDAAVNWGMVDTFSPSEHAGTAHPVNLQAYTIDGRRWLRSLECHLSLGYFINKPDACGWIQ